MAVDTREYYTNPMDIVTFLDGDKADGFMQTVLNKAFMFHEKNGISPIIKTEKQDFYLVDYYFLVHTFSDYVFGLLETVDEEVAPFEILGTDHRMGVVGDGAKQQQLTHQSAADCTVHYPLVHRPASTAQSLLVAA